MQFGFWIDLPPSVRSCIVVVHGNVSFFPGLSLSHVLPGKLDRKEGGLPYMTSVEKGKEGVNKCSKFADEQYRFCGQRGEGVNKSQNSVDVIFGSPQAAAAFLGDEGTKALKKEGRKEAFEYRAIAQ